MIPYIPISLSARSIIEQEVFPISCIKLPAPLHVILLFFKLIFIGYKNLKDLLSAYAYLSPILKC